jgi:hypothetical protein
VFAWLFPEQADSMIAEQVRSGTAKFSMACIPASVEFRQVDGRNAAVLHNPVFFTVSALDKPPADPSAVGKITEDPTVKMQELLTQLTQTAARLDTLMATAAQAGTRTTTTGSTAGAATTATVWVDPSRTTITWPTQQEAMRMNEELIAKLQADKAAAEAKVAELLTSQTALEEKLQAAGGDVAELAGEINDLKAKVSELETTLTEAQSAREALAAELTAAQATIAALEADKTALAEKLAAFEAKEVEAAKVSRLATRKAELPAAYLKAHNARKDEDRTKVEERWAGMSDEQWAEHRDELVVGFATAGQKVDYVSRSIAEGTLPAGTSGEESPVARAVRHVIKR